MSDRNIQLFSIAIRTGNVEVVRFMLNHGEDVNMKDENGSTPLHHLAAAENDHTELAKLLWREGWLDSSSFGCSEGPRRACSTTFEERGGCAKLLLKERGECEREGERRSDSSSFGQSA